MINELAKATTSSSSNKDNIEDVTERADTKLRIN